eukprot:5090431-Prymnesium_polylepis.2
MPVSRKEAAFVDLAVCGGERALTLAHAAEVLALVNRSIRRLLASGTVARAMRPAARVSLLALRVDLDQQVAHAALCTVLPLSVPAAAVREVKSAAPVPHAQLEVADVPLLGLALASGW